MARLQGKTLFFITSPRTPMKMQPEIELFVEKFSGRTWNTRCQEEFIACLATDPRFEGVGSVSDPAFSARDRINRGPKALGFVDIKPTIALTDAGRNFLDEELCQESLLRQMLKFQLPSPYHTETSNNSGYFCVKPYLEIFRLIYTLGHITFDELMIFGMQLVRYSGFETIVEKIRHFRQAKEDCRISYRTFMGQYRDNELMEIYADEIQAGNTRTRESRDTSIAKFIKTKASNLRDYTDACFRYLRATGIVSLSQKGKSLSILPEKEREVEFFLANIDRKPVFIDDEARYKQYLFNAELPILYTDNRQNLIAEVTRLGLLAPRTLETRDIPTLKKALRQATRKRKEALISQQVETLKDYRAYTDVMEVFSEIRQNGYYDVPLMLEWNTWRAMTMLDGGNIHANLKFDDEGQPLSTATGNMADIICDYGDFSLIVEVTMQTGQRQYESEGEPVSRHLAKVKREQSKEAFCFFIAPTINPSCIAHFFTLHLANIAYYGGKSVIIPIELEVFEKMVEQSHRASYIPNPKQIKAFCDYSMQIASTAQSETEWYEAIKAKALNWLAA